MTYASFLQRFFAALIDIGILIPLGVLIFWLQSSSRFTALVLLVPSTILFAAYSIYFHRRFGQTIGKRFARIKLVKVTGEVVGWREAWLRSSIDIAFAALTMISQYIALQSVSDFQYTSADGWTDRIKLLQSYEPKSLEWVVVASNIWACSELATMLLNKRRRALHDFIAGTVVVKMTTTTQPHRAAA